MSTEFIKIIPELHNQRYLIQMQNLIRNKISCGFFCGFNIPNNLDAMINNLKNIGFNFTCVIVIDDSSKTGGGDAVLYA